MKKEKKQSTAMRDLKLFGSLRGLTTAAMLTALSVVIGIFCKNFFTFNVYYRITFENIPIIIAGMLFGPIVGGAVGAVADVISCLCSTNPSVNPLITAGAVIVGVSAGITAKYIIKKRGILQTAVSVGVAHLFGQVAMKSLAKLLFFGMPWWGTFIGLGISVGVGIAEAFLINFIFRLFSKTTLFSVDKQRRGS